MPKIQNRLTFIKDTFNLTSEDISNLYNIPLSELTNWEEHPDTFPEYMFFMLMSSLASEDFIDEPPVILCDPRYMYPERDEFSASIINIKEWKKLHPRYIALVKLLNCGEHALLFELSSEKGRKRLESHKNMRYSEDDTVIII